MVGEHYRAHEGLNWTQHYFLPNLFPVHVWYFSKWHCQLLISKPEISTWSLAHISSHQWLSALKSITYISLNPTHRSPSHCLIPSIGQDHLFLVLKMNRANIIFSFKNSQLSTHHSCRTSLCDKTWKYKQLSLRAWQQNYRLRLIS